MNTQEILSDWIKNYVETHEQISILEIRRAFPLFVYHNYFARYKITVGKLDSTGMNPTDIKCFVIEISETDQTAKENPDTACESIPDLYDNISLQFTEDKSVCEQNPVWNDAPIPAKNPLAVMHWANDLEKDKFGCTRKDAAGNKKFHGGIDIKASVGTDCFATEDSVVTAIGYGSDLGKYVAIKFTKGGKVYGVAYCHLSKHDILHVGDYISAGDIVGKTGTTGNVGSDAPHLHLEVHNTEWVAYTSDVERSAHSLNPNNYIS